MKLVKRQLIWVVVSLALLTGCGPLKGIGQGLGDIFKGITLRFP